MENKVLAVVAGEEVTEQDLNDFMENVPQDQQAYRSNPQFRQQYLEQLIALRMFTKQGEELKLDETEEFKKIMEGARKDILAQLMVSETIKDITVTDEEAKSYFEANKCRFVKGETVRAQHILTETEEKCGEILAASAGGEKTFEDAAKEFSTCPSGGISPRRARTFSIPRAFSSSKTEVTFSREEETQVRCANGVTPCA